MPSMIHIESENLSVAWARAFLETLDTNSQAMTVTVSSLEDGVAENSAIRHKLDSALRSRGKPGCHTVANTVFPQSMWDPNRGRDKLFERYERAWPVIQRYSANRRCAGRNRGDTYFRRLTNYDDPSAQNGGFNQLDFIAETWARGNRRRSAFQTSTFMPPLDASHGQRLGFPCLQQISFTPTGSGGSNGLEVTALYPTQTVFDKAYGNYLGLCRLGQFMAHEMDLRLKLVRCIALRMNLANGRTTKGELESALRVPAEHIASA